MSTKNKKFKKLIYECTRKEGWELMIGSSLAYDKSIISLSTAILGFIFALSSKDDITRCKPLFVCISVLLILTILISLLSFWFDQKTGASILSQADRYYRDEEFYFEKGWCYYASIYSKILSGFLFMSSIVLVAVFFVSTR